MVRIIVFEILLLAVALYAVRRGGAPERLVAIMLLVAAWTTLLLPFNPQTGFRHLETSRLAVDGALLFGLIAVALRANRFWPLWLAAFQLVAVGVHGVRAYDAGVLPIVYARLTGQIAYPMCLVLAIGTWRYRQRYLRRAQGGVRDWSPLRTA